MQPTWLYRGYVAATQLVLPFAARARINRLRRDGVAIPRAHEVLGNSALDRPGGQLIWFHAASVGESLSALPIIEAMGTALPRAQFLITTATPSSAQILAARMPHRCIHQFAPLDAKGPITRFLKCWRPDAAIFVESELWPQMITRTAARGIPMAMIGARLSATSRKRWAKVPDTAAAILGCFRLILTQNAEITRDLAPLAPGARVETGANLKSLSPPLRYDVNALAELRNAVGDRPVWVAASTHPGEEAAALAAHAYLRRTEPDALLILAPRHPERGDEVAEICAAEGFTCQRRSTGTMPTGDVYLADTLGEMGLWYALAPVIFVGGSLVPRGGHNPYEVAHAGAAVLTGPHIANFAETYEPMIDQGAAVRVNEATDLGPALAHLLSTPDALAAQRAAASAFVNDQDHIRTAVAADLIKTLDLA